MAEIDDERRIDLARITAAAALVVAAAEPGGDLSSPWWSSADGLIHHLGRHFGWVSSALRSTDEPPRATGPVEGQPLADWFEAERDAYIALVNSLDPGQPAWTFVGPGQARFWFRRSIFEVARHLWDLRTAGGVAPPAPSELAPERYSDGVTEHFDVFLNRSRASLEPLPGALVFEATDDSAHWTIHENWRISDEPRDDATVVRASAGDLALLCWERADPFAASDRFVVSGPVETLRAFTVAPIHR